MLLILLLSKIIVLKTKTTTFVSFLIKKEYMKSKIGKHNTLIDQNTYTNKLSR
jgi:hypothetical protein